MYLSMAKSKRRSDCPINYALEIFGDRWTLLIIRDIMFKGKQYYSEFITSEEGIATNILADKLARLEESGIVSKTIDPTHKSRQIYKLTKIGVELVPVMVEMILWSAMHDHQTAADAAFVQACTNDKNGMIKGIMNRLTSEIL